MKTLMIGIAGVGGIGSNVALNLTRSGVAALRIVDFDNVEASNLNRQFYFRDQIGRPKVEALRENLQRIRPELVVEASVARIDAANCRSFFGDCDLVVEGFDKAVAKKMLMESLADGPLIVSASGVAGGELARIHWRRAGRAHIVGDFVSDCADWPLFSHKVVTVASHMSEFVLREMGAFSAVAEGSAP